MSILLDVLVLWNCTDSLKLCQHFEIVPVLKNCALKSCLHFEIVPTFWHCANILKLYRYFEILLSFTVLCLYILKLLLYFEGITVLWYWWYRYQYRASDTGAYKWMSEFEQICQCLLSDTSFKVFGLCLKLVAGNKYLRASSHSLRLDVFLSFFCGGKPGVYSGIPHVDEAAKLPGSI